MKNTVLITGSAGSPPDPARGMQAMQSVQALGETDRDRLFDRLSQHPPMAPLVSQLRNLPPAPGGQGSMTVTSSHTGSTAETCKGKVVERRARLMRETVVHWVSTTVTIGDNQPLARVASTFLPPIFKGVVDPVSLPSNPPESNRSPLLAPDFVLFRLRN